MTTMFIRWWSSTSITNIHGNLRPNRIPRSASLETNRVDLCGILHLSTPSSNWIAMTVKPIDFALDLLERADELAKRAGNPTSDTHCVEEAF